MNLRFDRSRKNLSAALKQLEDVIRNKIKDSHSHDLNISDSEEIDAAIIEKNAIITKLSDEVNRLQHELSELGKEAEFLKESNKALWQKIENFNRQKKSLVEAIAIDLKEIKNSIEKYDG
jgi:hypothetical protein